MIETNDSGNNHEVSYLNFLMEEYLEPCEGTREGQTAKSSRQCDTAGYFSRKRHPSARQSPKYSSNSWKQILFINVLPQERQAKALYICWRCIEESFRNL